MNSNQMKEGTQMGMFDKEVQLKNAEFAENGQTFTLHTGRFVGSVTTSFGDNVKAEVTAGPDKDKYIVYGVMAEQIGRMEKGELPAEVRITTDGQANVLARA